jgi:hypothetical protein
VISTEYLNIVRRKVMDKENIEETRGFRGKKKRDK